MPTDVTTAFTRGVVAHPRTARLLVFLELSHPSLPDAIRVVNDFTALDSATETRVPYIYAGKTYNSFPFEFALVTDNALVPQVKLRIQNVDKSIGQALLGITDPITVKYTGLSSADFAINGGGTAMVTSGADVQRQWLLSYLRNVTWDRLTIEGDLKGLDISREPFPYQRATPERAPGLWM
jgi:hypothetical protein